VDALAAESFLNVEHRVFGLRLRPLSLGHAFTLEAVGNPFYFGRLGSPAELRLAAWVCSREPLAALNTSTLRFALWRWWTRYLKLPIEAEKWKAYVADYVAPPQLWNKQRKAGEEEPKPSRIPNTVNTVVRLMRLGMSERQAWATPVGMSTWYEAAAYETETGNKLDIVTDSERLAILKAKARQ
jgi:hypothetical protein